MTEVVNAPPDTATIETERLAGPKVGRPVDRIDGPVKATGQAQYAADYPHPDLAHAALVHSTIPRGRITAIDTDEAAALPGVLAVVTHENAPPMKLPTGPGPMKSGFGAEVNYLHTDQVYWNGQAVAMVVAETPAIAEQAAALVRVHYERTVPPAVAFEHELDSAKPARGVPIMMPSRQNKGDALDALAKAPVSVDITVTTPGYNHNAIEPHSTIAVWDGDRLTVWDATQHIGRARSNLAKRFDVPKANVTVIAPYVGGGFGGKAGAWACLILTPLAARIVNRPVRMVLTREGVNRSVGGRPPTTQRLAIGAEPTGEFIALVHQGVNATSRLGGFPEGMTASTEHLYAAPHMLLERSVVELDMIANAPMRAPGSAVGLTALEIAVDELAWELGMDPIDLRIRNEAERTNITNKRIPHPCLKEVYALGAEAFGWSSRDPRPGSMRDGNWLVGMGVATSSRDANVVTADATVSLDADGAVVVRCGFQDSGMGTGTVVAQVVADEMGVPVEAVDVRYGDSRLPAAPGAFGSMHTSSVINGVMAACAKLRDRLDKLAARSGAKSEGYAAVLKQTDTPYVEATVGGDRRLPHLLHQAKGFRRIVGDMRGLARGPLGAQFCEVRVHADTGEVRISRWVAAFDIGAPLNEKLMVSQLKGAIVMGIGMGLTEEILVDPRTGRIMNPHLSDYHVPVHADIPKLDVRYIVNPDPTMPHGMYGLGELGVCGAAPAVSNAVYHATGRRIRDFPITPDKVLGL